MAGWTRAVAVWVVFVSGAGCAEQADGGQPPGAPGPDMQSADAFGGPSMDPYAKGELLDMGTAGQGAMAAVDPGTVVGPDGQGVAAPDADPAGCPRQSDDTGQVVLLGDSWWALTTIHPMLEEHTGSRYTRTHYLSGVSMTFPNAFGPPIPTQYDAARSQGPIKTVIMDGGGNDVLLHPAGALAASPCYGQISAECMRTIDDVVDTYDKLIHRMKADGVQDIVIFYYGYLPDPNYDAVMDLGAELGRIPCDAVEGCHFVDVRQDFRGHEIEYIGIDGIHPTPAGSQVVADAVARALVDECVEYY